MTPVIPGTRHVSHNGDEELSDEQIQELIKEAEGRVKQRTEIKQTTTARNKPSNHESRALENSLWPRNSRLSNTDENSITRARPHSLVSKEMRQLTEEGLDRLLTPKPIDTASHSSKMVSTVEFSLLQQFT